MGRCLASPSSQNLAVSLLRTQEVINSLFVRRSIKMDWEPSDNGQQFHISRFSKCRFRMHQTRLELVRLLPDTGFSYHHNFHYPYQTKGLWSGLFHYHAFLFRYEVYSLYTFCLARRYHNALTIVKGSSN